MSCEAPLDQCASPAATRRFCLALALALGLLLGPSILGGKAVSSADLLSQHPPWMHGALAGVQPEGEHSDPVFYFDPWFRYARASLEHGGPPRRNTLSTLGVPFLGNAQSALYSPFTLPYYLLEEGTATWVSAFLKMFLAGLGAFLLAGSYGRGGLASATAGLGFAGCGFVVLWLSYPLSSALVPLPWALLGVRRLRHRPRVGIPLLGVSIAVAVLGGHPECAFHTGALAFAFFLRELWTARRTPGASLLRMSARFALGAAAAGLLAAPQILPFLDYLVASGALEVRSDPRIRALRMAHPPGLDSPTVVAGVLATLSLCLLGVRFLLRRARAQREGEDSAPGARGLDLGAVAVSGAALAAFVLLALQGGAWNGFALLLQPHFYGVSDALPGELRYVGPVNAIELAGGYLGAGLLLLALLAPALGRRVQQGETRWKLAAFLGCLFVAFDIPPFSQALFLLPPFDIVVNRRLLGEAALLGVLLAADSIDGLRLAGPGARRGARRVLAVLCLGGLGAFALFDARALPLRDGRGDLLERLSLPLGSPCAALETPRARAAVPGDTLPVRGYLVSLQEYDRARVRLTHRESGRFVETEAAVGLPEPGPVDETIRRFPNASRSGFAGNLDLEGFPGGDCDISVMLPADTGDERPILQYRLRVVRSRGPGRAWWTVPASLLALLGLLAVGGGAVANAGTAAAAGNGRTALRRGCALLLGASIALDLGSHALQHIPQIPREHLYPPFAELEHLRTPHGRVLPSAAAQEVLRPNSHMAYGLAAIEGVDVLGSQRATRFLNSVRAQVRESTPLGLAVRFDLRSPAFPLLGVQRLLVPREVPVREDEARLVFEGPQLKVLEPVATPIRAHFYTRWVKAEEGQSSAQWLEQHEAGAQEVLIFPHDAPVRAGVAATQAAVGAQPADSVAVPEARLILDHPHRIEAEVAPGEAGWLLITDLYSPAFQAEVDGRPARVLRADDALLAVELPASDSSRSVVLHHRPWTHRAGWALAALGALLLGGASFPRRRRAAMGPDTDPDPDQGVPL